MCNIIRFLPGQMIDEEKFFNCVYNNWHSYGLVTKSDGKMQIDRVVPESGEIDPKEIWTKIKKNIDVERILHVRHNTAGKTDMENCHPIDILYIPGKRGRGERQIVFMHNGTMSEYKSKTIVNGITRDDDDGPSDTRNFAEQVLQPIIQADYGSGVGDLSNATLKKILTKFWTFGNRGVLIANDQPSLFLGEWKEFGVGDVLKVANTEYFDKVTRGPEFSRREAAKKQSETPSRTIRSFSNIKDFPFDAKHGFFRLSESACNLLSDWDIYNREHAVSVGYMTQDELSEIYKNKNDCIHLMDWVFTDYAVLYKENLELEEKLKRSSNKIAEMVEEFKRKHGEKPQSVSERKVG